MKAHEHYIKISIQQILFLLALFFMQCLHMAEADEQFDAWLTALRADAIAAGVAEETVQAVIDHVRLIPDVIALDRSQPEFISPFLSYYYRRVDTDKILKGRALLAGHHKLLARLEAQYGVPKTVLLSFWGMETNYGSNKGNIDTLSALATLAYEGRRAAFFRKQLLDAMRMLDAGYVDLAQFQGSWAGAFGHMQFMPATFMLHAVDGDQDGKIDVTNSMPDAFASAARYLSQVGWRMGEPVMLEVQLPAGFAWQDARLTVRKTVEEWASLGVRAMAGAKAIDERLTSDTPTSKGAQPSQLKRPENGKNKNPTQSSLYLPLSASADNALSLNALPDTTGTAAIVLPQGWKGPAFMVFDNFDVIMDWNRSVNYALSVAQLARRINQQSRIIGGQQAEQGALSFEQMLQLQQVLNGKGFDAGEPDGLPGLKTQNAIREYQQSMQLPADGYASPSLYTRLTSEE